MNNFVFAYWVDKDQKVSFAKDVLNRATMDVRKFKNVTDFNAEWAMVVTWFEVKPVPSLYAGKQVGFS